MYFTPTCIQKQNYRKLFSTFFMCLFLAILVPSLLIAKPLVSRQKTVQNKGKQKVEELLTFIETKRESLRSNYSDENYRSMLDAAITKTRELVDFEEVSKLALGAYYNKMSEKQKENFRSLFHQLISSRAIGNRQKPQAEVLQKKIPFKIIAEVNKHDKLFNKEAVVVKSEIWDEQITYEVDIYFYRGHQDKNLKIYDVYIDDASLLLDYRNQFARIMKDKGIDYLISLLEKKIKSLDAPSL